jgi:L-aminopeptidase/D-esterase-like protein
MASVGEVRVGVLSAVNAVGDVFSVTGESLTGGHPVPGPPALVPAAFTDTTLIVVATDASLSRIELTWLAVRAHDALAVCVRPAHSRYDGDIVFAVSCGEAKADIDAVAEAAFEATAASIVDAVRSAAR